MGDRDKDVEILVLRRQITVLKRPLGADTSSVRFAPEDRAYLAALLTSLPRGSCAGCGFSSARVSRGLAIAVEVGYIPDRPLGPATSLLHGGLCESALDIARATDQRAALEDSLAEPDLVLAGVAGRSAPGCAQARSPTLSGQWRQ
ncbi:hypothetical protein [Nonomuraea sp. NPDC002799]